MGIAAQGNFYAADTLADRSAGQYGGSYKGTRSELDRASNAAEGWRDRYGSKFSAGWGIDWKGADAARAQAMDARAEQVRGREMARQSATGGMQSRSSIQAKGAMEDAVSAGARGHAPADMRGALALGSGVAGENAAGMRAYGAGAAGVRNADLRMAGQDFSRVEQSGDLRYRQQALADQMENYYNRGEYGINTANMAAEESMNRAAEQRALAVAKAQSDNEQAVLDAMSASAAMMGTAASIASDVGLKRYFGRMR